MRSKHSLIGVLLLVFLSTLLIHSTAHAVLQGLFLNVYMKNNNGSHVLEMEIKVIDSRGLRGPEALTSLKLVTPADTAAGIASQTLNLSIGSTWEEWDHAYYPSYPTSQFGSSGKVPMGTYTVTAVGGGVTMTASDTLTSSTWLTVPTVTNLSTSGATAMASTMPTIKWSAVSGATHYRLQLLQVWGYGTTGATWWPIYLGTNQILTNGLQHTFPPGALRAASTYVLRLEARDSDKNISKKSRTQWLYFTTP